MVHNHFYRKYQFEWHENDLLVLMFNSELSSSEIVDSTEKGCGQEKIIFSSFFNFNQLKYL